ncbi:hypothetical protein [Luteolibacter sp. LG18]|uniref:hypothetical protein n=1 Tax=Luteolibacter sp. LG18 TaxID=2819286 RepID=UPI002B2D65FC|nr:hypothetical protein llg_25470 [Luteolibacter sp. LG18]
MSSSRKAALFAVLLVIALIAFLMMKRPETESATTSVPARPTRPASPADPNTARRSAAPRGIPAKKAADDPESPEARHFRNFYLRPVDLGSNDVVLRLQTRGILHLTDQPARITLQEAVAWVKSEYAAIAKETGEPALPLEIDLTAANLARPVHFRVARLPVTSVLRLIAAATGNRLTGTGPDFRMEALPNQNRREQLTLDIGQLDTNRLRPPEESADKLSFPGLEIAGQTGTPNSWTQDLVSQLTSAGYTFSPEFSFTPDDPGRGNSTATVNGNAADFELLRAALEVTRTDLSAPQQAKLTTTLIELPEDLDTSTIASGNLNPDAYHAMMGQFASMEGTDILTLPSVLTRYGHSASVEISGSKDSQGVPQSGLHLNLLSQPLGLGSEDSFNFKQTPATTADSPAGEPLVQIAGQTVVPGGNHNVTIGKSTDGHKVVVVRNSERVDATGRPIPLADGP